MNKLAVLILKYKTLSYTRTVPVGHSIGDTIRAAVGDWIDLNDITAPDYTVRVLTPTTAVVLNASLACTLP